MQVQIFHSQEPRSPQDSLPFGFQKLPVGASVSRYVSMIFYYVLFFFLVFLYYIFKRQYLLYCEFAVEDA